MFGIGRREFITLLGGAAVSWPLAAHAQRGKPALMGLLGSGTAAAQSEWTAAFVQRLRELGWSEGRNLTIEYRWAEGRSERFAEIAAEFVRLKVDVIVTHNTLPPLAAKQATSVIPIVFATAGDPVGTGIVESLARPGGNVIGLSSQQPESAGKRLEILSEFVPGLRRLAVLFEPGNPFSAAEFDGVSTVAPTLGLELIPFEIRRAGEIAPAFESIRSRAQAIYVFPNPTGRGLPSAGRPRVRPKPPAGRETVRSHPRKPAIYVGGMPAGACSLPRLATPASHSSGTRPVCVGSIGALSTPVDVV